MFHSDTGVTMSSRSILSCLIAVFLSLSLPVIELSASTFIQITDTHIKSHESIGRFQAVLDDIEAQDFDPAFIVNTGDITEIGSLPEYKSYLDIVNSSSFPFYHLIGNHDVRWSNVGKQRFLQQLGPLYQSFELGSIQLILLDTGVLSEQYGHYSLESLNWLRDELAKLEKDRPVIICSHHPPFTASRYIDNELELFRIIEGYNIVLYLCGHGHQNDHWVVDGIDFFMTKAVMADDPGYRIIEITDNQKINVYTRTLSTGTRLELTRSFKSNRLDIDISVRSPRIDRSYDDNLPVLVTIVDVCDAQISIDHRNWLPLERSGSKFLANFYIGHLPEGKHTLLLKLSDVNGKTGLKIFDFVIDRDNTQLAFTVQTGGEIQSTPLLHENSIFFGASDGCLYNLDITTGEQRWKFASKGPITTQPVLSADTLFFTSGDGVCYALNSNTGAKIWKAPISESIFSSPIHTNGRLLFGASDSCMNCISSKDGSILWKFKTDGFIKAKPAINFDKVLFGSWDGYFYCISLHDGNLRWKRQIAENFYYAPATSNPLIVSNRVYFTSHDHKVHALDLDSGEIVWEHSDSEHQAGYSSPNTFDDKIILGSLSGRLFALSEDSGREIWSETLSDSLDPVFDSSPTIDYPQVVIGSINGNLYGVLLDTGEKAWSYRLNNGYIFATPAFRNKTVYIGSTDGYFYAIQVL